MTCTEGSLSCRLELGASCSPIRQFLYLSVDAKESSRTVEWACRMKEASVSRLRSSLDIGKRIIFSDVKLPFGADPKLLALVPQRAVIGPQEVSTSAPTIIPELRVAIDYLPSFDLKHHAFCLRCSGVLSVYGGMGYSVSRDNWGNAEALMMTRAEYIKNTDKNDREQNLFLHDVDYWAECVDHIKEHLAKFAEQTPNVSLDDLHEEAKKEAALQKHSFTKGEMPFSFMSLIFYCVLHLDTNLGAVIVELYEDYAHQLAAARGLAYSDPKSPHARFHKALDDSGLEPIATRLRNRLKHVNKDPQDFRLLGPHVVDMMRNIWRFDAALRVENETDPEWLERNTIGSLLIMHRHFSSMHSQFTMKKTDVPALVEMGKYMLRLISRLHLPRSYNVHYMTIGNPMMLARHMERFAISEMLVCGLQALGSAQVCKRVSCVLCVSSRRGTDGSRDLFRCFHVRDVCTSLGLFMFCVSRAETMRNETWSSSCAQIVFGVHGRPNIGETVEASSVGKISPFSPLSLALSPTGRGPRPCTTTATCASRCRPAAGPAATTST